MTNNTKTCLTAKQVASALAIYDTDEQTGETIAQAMLDGDLGFTPAELKTLASYKGIEVYELARHNNNNNMIRTAIFQMLEGFTVEQLTEILDRLHVMSKTK